jgi:hypothetical protein
MVETLFQTIFHPKTKEPYDDDDDDSHNAGSVVMLVLYIIFMIALGIFTVWYLHKGEKYKKLATYPGWIFILLVVNAYVPLQTVNLLVLLFIAYYGKFIS